MQGVMLDAGSLGTADLDLGPLHTCLESLECYDNTAPLDVVERLKGKDIALVNKVLLDEAVFAQLPNLKHIIVLATGVNNIDLESARNHGISVQNCRAYGVDSVAQHCLMLMLTLSTKMLEYRTAVFNGAWSESDHFCLLDFPVESLSGKTLGIVGYGDLGKGVARLAKAFGMSVMVAKRDGQTSDSIKRVGLEELLPQVDILSLHCPLNEQTKNLIGFPQLCQMKNSALLINCARGGVVNEADLVKALDEKQISGAGVDVLVQEPPPINNPLLVTKRDNLIVTPHTAWASRQARQTIVLQASENIISLKSGHKNLRQI
jgi:glycerate dehydrogenase